LLLLLFPSGTIAIYINHLEIERKRKKKREKKKRMVIILLYLASGILKVYNENEIPEDCINDSLKLIHVFFIYGINR